ncbi:MAG: hypothetical protein PHI63_06290 [Patescibacteria group bacterium]|nr:hypothetical protein [Patescibacteria group bacterium]
MGIILDAFYSLGKNLNKAQGRSLDEETNEGVVSDKFPELKLDLPNEDIIKLTEKWQKSWQESAVFSEWNSQGKQNEEYWRGKQSDLPKAETRRPLIDNVIFESLETYLPEVTRRNPDPMVTLRRSEKQDPENLAYASELQKELAETADEIVLRLKLKKAARHWAIYLLGALKLGWDLDKDIPTVKVIRPQKLILDPDATVDEDGYTGKFYGEHRKLAASSLISMLDAIGGEEEGVAKIKELAKSKDGGEALATEIGFIEWWTDEYVCWTLGDKVLMKKKNPHWNYATQKEAPYDATGKPQLDTEGKPLMESVPGINHFPVPAKPYVLLSVFNLGKQPVDETSLIGQNLASQDLVNKRLRQIDKNADSMNGGMVVSLERSGLTQAQAKGVTDALRRGGTVTIPAGAVTDAVARMSANPLPQDIYLQLQDTRTRMRDIFGTSGSVPAGIINEDTVRGKLQNRVLDTDRIGGGLSEYLEQVADVIYNWFVQLLYVYDERYAGKPHPKVMVSVKAGSLLPKDSITMANQAIELAGAGKMSLLDLFRALDYPNPEEMAANMWLEVNAPELLFVNDQRVKQVMESRRNASAAKPPSESISFKDLPPEGKAQMAAQAGITLHPEAIAAFDDNAAKGEIAKDVLAEAAKRSIPQPTLPAPAGE